MTIEKLLFEYARRKHPLFTNTNLSIVLGSDEKYSWVVEKDGTKVKIIYCGSILANEIRRCFSDAVSAAISFHTKTTHATRICGHNELS